MTDAFAPGDASGRGLSQPEGTTHEPSGLPWSTLLRWSGQPRVAVDVLVVDDSEDIRRSLAEILGMSGYSVALAADGDSTLQLLEHLEVGVILLDLSIPDMDGIALLDALKIAPPVIVLSGASLDDETWTRLGSKVAAYLQKPVDPHHLLGVVADIIGRDWKTSSNAPEK